MIWLKGAVKLKFFIVSKWSTVLQNQALIDLFLICNRFHAKMELFVTGSRGANIGGCVGCDPPIIESLHFVGRNPSKILANVGYYRIVTKKVLFNFLFFQLYLLSDIPSASLRAYYQVPALCTRSSWRYFLCHAQEQNFEIFATKWQSELSTAAKEDVAYC